MHVAVPLLPGDVDLFVYSNLGADTNVIICPVRLRASATRSFSVDARYESIPNLIHVFIWGLGGDQASIYALTHREAVFAAEELGYSLGSSPQKDLYATPHASRNLGDTMERYRMTPEKWTEKIASMAGAASRELSAV